MLTEPPFLDLSKPGFSTKGPEVMAARRASWCARTPFGLAVLRHREAGQLLRDRRLRQGSYAWPDTMGLAGSFAAFWKRSVISQEGQVHKAQRRLAQAALSPEFIASLVPDFDRSARDLIAKLQARDSCEFIHDFTEPFAGRAIATLLGLPATQATAIARDAAALGLAMGLDCKAHEPVFNAACDRLTGLARDLIARARDGRDRGGFVARLVASARDAPVPDQVLLDLVVISIFGGVDTTRAQLGFAMALFADHPDQWRMLRADPTLVPQAIEEVIRAWPTTTWSTREAVASFDFGGVRIGKGETLHMLVHATATDPRVAPDWRFDISARRKMHFGFGGGAHHCLGQLVARTDMACALDALAATFDTVGYAGTPEWLPDSGNTSPKRLPLTFTAAPAGSRSGRPSAGTTDPPR